MCFYLISWLTVSMVLYTLTEVCRVFGSSWSLSYCGMRFLLLLVVWQSMWGPCSCLLNVNKLHCNNALLSAAKTVKVISSLEKKQPPVIHILSSSLTTEGLSIVVTVSWITATEAWVTLTLGFGHNRLRDDWKLQSAGDFGRKVNSINVTRLTAEWLLC